MLRNRLKAVVLWFLVCGCGGTTLDLAGADDEVAAVEADAVFASNGIQLSNGLNLGNGYMLGNGTKLSNGIMLGNGIVLGNGVNIPNGLSASNGFKLRSGFAFAGGTVLSDGWAGPYIQPPRRSDLEKWIDVDPNNQLRILRYLTECALPKGLPLRVYYRNSVFTFYGLVGLGVSWATGADFYAGTSDDTPGLTPEEQEKVSACLLARVNARQDSMVLMMVGNVAPLNTLTCKDNEYGEIDEAAFYGNLFLNPPQAFFCLQEEVTDWRTSRACRLGVSTYDCGVVRYTGACYLRLGDNALGTDPNRACSGMSNLGISCADGTHSEYTYNDCRNPEGTRRWKYSVTADFAAKARGEWCLHDWECALTDACVSGVCAGG